MEQPIVIDVHGGLESRYFVEEQRPDGAVLIRPDTSVAGILARLGERQLTRDQSPDGVHELPTEDEG